MCVGTWQWQHVVLTPQTIDREGKHDMAYDSFVHRVHMRAICKHQFNNDNNMTYMYIKSRFICNNEHTYHDLIENTLYNPKPYKRKHTR